MYNTGGIFSVERLCQIEKNRLLKLTQSTLLALIAFPDLVLPQY